MSDKAQRRTAAEQYGLIMECRSSGMSDHQWCAHDINRNRNFTAYLFKKDSALNCHYE